MRRDWDLIRREYITSALSLKDICEKYNIPFSSLYFHSSREKWYNLRKEYCKNMDIKFLKRKANKKIKEDWQDRQKRIDKFKKIVDNTQELILNADKYKQIKVKSRETLMNAGVEASRHIELLEGGPTERTEYSEKEKEERLNRLQEYLRERKN